MLSLLDTCPVRGVFCYPNGEPMTDQEVAGLLGGDTAENLRCIEELLRKEVASRNQKGAIYSRRMVRDESERLAARDRKRKQRDCHTVVPLNVTSNVTRLSEEEIEVGKEAGSEFQKVALVWEKGAFEIRAQQAYCDLLDQGEKPDAIFGGLKAIDAIVRQEWGRDDLPYLPKLATMLTNRRYKENPILWTRPQDALAMEAKVGGR